MVGRKVQSRSTCETFVVMIDATYVAAVVNRQNCRGHANAARSVRGKVMVEVAVQKVEPVEPLTHC